MSDWILLRNMRFQGRHGYGEEERSRPQPFEVDVELGLDLGPAGRSDDLERSVDYGPVYEVARRVVEAGSYRLLETVAETIAAEVLASFPVDEVRVRVRKPAVDLGGPLDYSAVEIHRTREARDPRGARDAGSLDP